MIPTYAIILIMATPEIIFIIIILCRYFSRRIKNRTIKSTDPTGVTVQRQNQTVTNNFTSPDTVDRPEALPSGYLSQNYSSSANYGSAFANFQIPTAPSTTEYPIGFIPMVPPPGYSAN